MLVTEAYSEEAGAKSIYQKWFADASLQMVVTDQVVLLQIIVLIEVRQDFRLFS